MTKRKQEQHSVHHVISEADLADFDSLFSDSSSEDNDNSSKTPTRNVKPLLLEPIHKKLRYQEPFNGAKLASVMENGDDEGETKVPKVMSFHSMYQSMYEREMTLKKKRMEHRSIPRKHEYQLDRYSKFIQSSGDKRIRALRSTLEQLDRLGYMRSAHQRQFHEAFIASCLPQIYGSDLEKNLVRILRQNNMEEIRCEIMVCCPRRWGKTMAVALYAAAYLWSQPDAEVLIYSIAKRTSSMLMAKIYNMVVKLAGGTHVIKTHNQEDLEVVNLYGQTSVCHSYPAASKISIFEVFVVVVVVVVRAHARIHSISFFFSERTKCDKIRM